MHDAPQDFWVFGYGSLMWRPGFDYVECQTGLLRGWRRSMCVLSTHYRGTPERPGLVLGLDRGGACLGRAFRVEPSQAEAVRLYLHEREMIADVYHPRWLPVSLRDGRRVRAYGFVANAGHAQYTGRLTDAEAAALIRAGRGEAGSCRDYLANTVEHLRGLGIRDALLCRLLAVVDGTIEAAAKRAEARARRGPKEP